MIDVLFCLAVFFGGVLMFGMALMAMFVAATAVIGLFVIGAEAIREFF